MSGILFRKTCEENNTQKTVWERDSHSARGDSEGQAKGRFSEENLRAGEGRFSDFLAQNIPTAGDPDQKHTSMAVITPNFN